MRVKTWSRFLNTIEVSLRRRFVVAVVVVVLSITTSSLLGRTDTHKFFDRGKIYSAASIDRGSALVSSLT